MLFPLHHITGILYYTAMALTRIEKDTFGEVAVPADKLYGAMTARSKANFNIGDSRDVMPVSVHYACSWCADSLVLSCCVNFIVNIDK